MLFYNIIDHLVQVYYKFITTYLKKRMQKTKAAELTDKKHK